MNLIKIAVALASTLAVFIIILIGVSWFTQVRTGEPIVKREVTIEYWGSIIPDEVINPLIADYAKIKPDIKITYSKKNFENYDLYRETLIQRLRSKTGPTMFSAHQGWMQFLNTQNTNLVSESNDQIDKNGYKEKYFEVFKTSCLSRQDKIICIPLAYDGLILIYNKDMFAQKNLTPPVTWEDVRYASQRLVQRDSNRNIVVGGVGAGLADNVTNASDILALMYSQSKLKIPDDLDTEKSVNTAMYYVDFYKRDKVWDQNMPESVNAFAVGKLGMVFVKGADIERIISVNPTLSFGAVTAPQLPDAQGTTTASHISGSWVETVSVNASSDEQRESWSFLLWLTEPNQQQKLATLYKQYIGVEMVSPLKELKDTYRSDYAAAMVQTAPTATFSVFSQNTGNRDFSDIYMGLIDMASSQSGDMYTAFKKAEEDIKTVFRERL